MFAHSREFCDSWGTGEYWKMLQTGAEAHVGKFWTSFFFDFSFFGRVVWGTAERPR